MFSVYNVQESNVIIFLCITSWTDANELSTCRLTLHW